MSGSAGLFNKQKIIIYLVGSPKVGDGKHKKIRPPLLIIKYDSDCINKIYGPYRYLL